MLDDAEIEHSSIYASKAAHINDKMKTERLKFMSTKGYTFINF